MGIVNNNKSLNKTLKFTVWPVKLAKSLIMSVKLTIFAILHSILSSARSHSLSWVIVLCVKFFISLSVLKERSAEVTVTCKVQNTLNAVQTLQILFPA